MSTKIYNAYRVHRCKDWWPLLMEIRRQGERNAVKAVRQHYIKEMREMNITNPEYLERCKARSDTPEWRIRLDLVHARFREEEKEAKASPYRSLHNLEVSISVYRHETGIYLLAHCDGASLLRGCLDFLNTHPNLRDFHYQNQADRPDEVSAREWNRRRKIWDDIMGDDVRFRDRMMLNVCTHDGFYIIDPWLDLAQTYCKKPPKFPTYEEVLAGKLRKLDNIKRVSVSHRHISGHGLVETEESAETLDFVISKKSKWRSEVGHKVETHDTLHQAFDRVWFEYTPYVYKLMVQQVIKSRIPDISDRDSLEKKHATDEA